MYPVLPNTPIRLSTHNSRRSAKPQRTTLFPWRLGEIAFPFRSLRIELVAWRVRCSFSTRRQLTRQIARKAGPDNPLAY